MAAAQAVYGGLAALNSRARAGGAGCTQPLGGSQGLTHGSSSPSAGSSDLLTTSALLDSPVRHKALLPSQVSDLMPG